MITVAIFINGNPIIARSARNQTHTRGKKTKYKCDNGSVIWHNRGEGAVELAKRMLDTVKEF